MPADQSRSTPSRSTPPGYPDPVINAPGALAGPEVHTQADAPDTLPHTGARMTTNTQPPRIDFLDRALDIIEALARLAPASLSDLARETGLSPATALRLLRGLQARYFAVQDKRRGPWRLGPRWRAIGEASASQGSLDSIAQPYLDRLAVECGEAIYLDGLDGLAARTIALSRPDPRLPLFAQLGARRFLHAGAPRMLLAYARPEFRDIVLRQRLPRLTTATRTDPAWITADLKRLRGLGWLLAQDEIADGEITLAVPVHDGTGHVPLVLSLSAARLRLSPARARGFLPALLGSAARLGAAIGIAPAMPPHSHPGEEGGSGTEGGDPQGTGKASARSARRKPPRQVMPDAAPDAGSAPGFQGVVQGRTDRSWQILSDQKWPGMMPRPPMQPDRGAGGFPVLQPPRQHRAGQPGQHIA